MAQFLISLVSFISIFGFADQIGSEKIVFPKGFFVNDDLDFNGNIKTHNMAKGTTWLARAISTEDAVVKDTYTDKPTEQVSRFKLGGPSTVVLVLSKTEGKSL